MAEEKARILRLLEALSQCEEPTRPGQIGAIIGETPLHADDDLFELERSGLAEKPDKEKTLYLITDNGRETLENPPETWVRKPQGEISPGKPPGEIEEITVPSQSGLFRNIGRRLGVEARKDGARDENRAKIGR